MSARNFTATAAAVLCAMTGTFALFPTAATAGGFIHKYLTQISEVPNEPGVIAPGPLGEPAGIASDGQDIYVGDPANGVLDEFNESGAFVRQFPAVGLESIAVNRATGEIYIGYGASVDVYSPTGVLLGVWNAEDASNGPFSGETLIAIDNAPATSAHPMGGDVYVLDRGTAIVDIFKPEAGGKETYVSDIKLPSALVNPSEEDYVNAFAENETTGNVVVGYDIGRGPSSGEYVQVFQSTVSGVAEPLTQLEEPAFGALSLSRADGLAVDSSTGSIYMSGSAFEARQNSVTGVYQYSATGTYLYELTGSPGGFGSPAGGVAIGAGGDVDVADRGSKVVDIFSPDILIPDVTTTQPSRVGGVAINGTVDPNGTPIVKCEFEYGLTSSYGLTAPCASIPSGNSPEPVSAHLSNLALHTVYHYRLVVTDEEGYASYGEDVLLYTAPVVDSSTQVSNITSFAATLTGVIEPGIITPSYHFVYGTTIAYGSVWPQPDATTGTGGQQPVTQTLTGLQPGTTYHFALVATNFGGFESVGSDQTFTTRPLVPPAVNTGGSEAITQTTATLTGSVNPEGLPTTYRFEYGPTAAYGSTWPLMQVFAGTGSTAQGVAVAVPDLQPGTGYHYRLVASNEDGTTYGSDQSFATPAYPVSIVQEPTTLPTIKAKLVKAKKAPVKKIKKKVKAKKRSKRGKSKRK